MDDHFGFRDLALPQAGGRLILGAIAPPLLPWVFPVSGFADARTSAWTRYRYPVPPPTAAMPHYKARHPLMGFATT